MGLCYCLIMTVTDYPNGAVIVSLFGRTLDRIFGLPASQMHKYEKALDKSDQVAYAAPRSFAFIDSMGRWGAQ